jgi:hypothetical protein
MIKYLWQLPQNLLGLVVIKVTRAVKYKDFWLTTRGHFGVSLGDYVIFGGRYTPKDLKHEQGHQKQSLYLGPLYLLVIGLPSVVGNLLNRIIPFDYYKQPWEAWADKLGGVKR